MNNMAILLSLLLVWNLLTLTLMGIDKRKAVRHKYRISENMLFLCAFLLGGVGIIFGMYIFRHKTKHWSFKILVPLAVIANLFVSYFIFQRI